MKLTKYPGNPILKPHPDHPWENLVVCNPGAWYENGLFTMLYRLPDNLGGAMTSPLLVQGLFNEQVQPDAVNVGHSQSISLNQLLEAVRQVLGSLPDVTYGEARPGDIRHSRADSTLLRQRFQLGAATPLAQGLARLLGR